MENINKVYKTKNSTDNLCDICSLEVATCPKALHLKFGNGKGNDNIIECSECIPKEFEVE